MIKQSNKLKRGTKLIIIETGEIVKLNRIKENGEYFCEFGNGAFESFALNELKEFQKSKTPISKEPKQLTPTQAQNKAIRNDFFAEVTKDMPFNCMNCKKPLYAFTKWSKRCCAAHILPKSKFPSIAENKDNIVFMGVDLIAGVCNCHTEYDSSVEKRTQMPIYNLVLKRYHQLMQHLTEREIVMANDYLGL